MKFRTECRIEIDEIGLSPEKPVIGVGSCFADNIIRRMKDCLWDAQNPFGALFNPLSIESAVRLCLSAEPENIFLNSLFHDKTLIHSFLFDSGFSGFSQEEVLKKFRDARLNFRQKLIEGRTLIVTFGTAYVYLLKENGRIAANCHKQPASLFERKRLTVDEITGSWSRLFADLRSFCPDMRVIFTVSPVRHIKDGLHGNNLSKATLLLAVEKLCGQFGFCSYFPAYELVTDDLRDYRFYASDLVHPSETAIDYIWEKFVETFLTPEGKRIVREGEAIAKRAAHRHMVAAPDEIEKFNQETQRLLDDFMSRHHRTNFL